MPFSILILTRNEQDNIQACIRSVAWCDDVVVLDSQSTDRTCAIAESLGARVFSRPFDSFAGQRNHALEHLPFAHDWVFNLDADERFTDALRRECEAVAATDLHSAYRVASKLMFMGQWLRRSGDFPVFQTRLVKRGEWAFTQHGHGQADGAATRGIGTLHEAYEHYSFSKGLSEWFERHNKYSTLEALAQEQPAGRLREIFSPQQTDRRAALRRLARASPLAPFLRFGYLYLLRRGFLDGIPGLGYSGLMACYELMIIMKQWERRSGAKSTSGEDV